MEFEDKIQYLTDVPTLASKHRDAKRAQRLIKEARFPVVKTLDGYQSNPIRFPVGFDKEQLMSLEFIEQKKNILCTGAVGTGKTYLATALGVHLIVDGRKTLAH